MEKQVKMRDDLTSDTLSSQENVYELEELKTTSEASVKEDIQPAVILKSTLKQSVWSTPFVVFIVLAVLLSLILVLQVIILCLILAHVLTVDVNTTAISSTSNSPNFTEWAEDITEIFDQKFPNFTEWAEDLVYEVNTNVTQSFPNFTEWAEHVVEMIGRTFPNFTEWANSIVYGVNTNVTKSLPNFTEWSNGVVSKVNTNVTQSLPNLTEWSNGVVSNVTQSLPNFTEWSNGIVSKVNINVTQSLPNFSEWADGVVFKVNANVTQSLPNFNEWSNGVAFKVSQSIPNFSEWSNGVAFKVTQSLPNFSEWSNGVVSKVNANVTQSLPNFNEWSNGVVSKVSINVTQSTVQWIDALTQNTFQLLHNFSTLNSLSEKILITSRDSSYRLINIINTLYNLRLTSISTAGVVDDIRLEMLVLRNESATLPTSCEQIKSKHPSSQSGYYILATVGNRSATYTAYCNMGKLCGSGGGWTRLAYLDMSDAIQKCPSGFRLYQRGSVRACGRYRQPSWYPVNYGSCASVQFPSNKMNYSQVCGRVIGYQYGHTDSSFYNRNNLNSAYVDGVSITRGSPRQHVWTLMSGYSSSSAGSGSCPCNTGSTITVPSFIGSNYFCESGNYGAASVELHTSDPLWDGQGCGSLETACCNAPGLPWFHRDYGSTTTTDYLELRVCADEGANGEDAPVSYYEIYVK